MTVCGRQFSMATHFRRRSQPVMACTKRRISRTTGCCYCYPGTTTIDKPFNALNKCDTTKDKLAEALQPVLLFVLELTFFVSIKEPDLWHRFKYKHKSSINTYKYKININFTLYVIFFTYFTQVRRYTCFMTFCWGCDSILRTGCPSWHVTAPGVGTQNFRARRSINWAMALKYLCKHLFTGMVNLPQFINIINIIFWNKVNI
jgi:hypothetical protein